MKKVTIFMLVLALIMSLGMVGLAADEEVLTGEAEGFGGTLQVEVTRVDGVIKSIEVTHAETAGIGDTAIDQLVDLIIENNSTDVDIVGGATASSKALIEAVDNALASAEAPVDPSESEEEPEETEDEPVETTEPAEEPSEPVEEPVKPVEEIVNTPLMWGTAVVSNGREMRSPDNTDTPVYTLNIVYGSVLFDIDGRIVDMFFDTMEVATPNYDGEGMPYFGGWPGQGGYNYDEDKDGEVDGTIGDTEEEFLASVEAWKSKRDRGDGYRMVSGSWADEMDAYQEFFVGMTVDEVEAWVEKHTSDVNGRPLKEDSDKEGDADKYAALTDEEKEALADLTASATMSLTDNHGDLIATLRKAYENRVSVEIDVATQYGLGFSIDPRVGPGKDSEDVQVYSVNLTVATVLMNEEETIEALRVDTLEVASPNYDGEGMPHFSGWPGQGGYNYDEDHDGEIDEKTPDSLEWFLEEVELWLTKRDRGDDYQMVTGSWSDQMDAYQAHFTGMTLEEVEAWVAKHTSDVNGRPLKEDSEREGDPEKYAELTDEEKEALMDLTAHATMSLTDAHGNIIEAIANAIDNAREVLIEMPE
ncbi:MAG TPA: FMN-binding protein [Fastidiosipila sp.]|nr:FMN-binding protein [Fastidiosipila sp.]